MRVAAAILLSLLSPLVVAQSPVAAAADDAAQAAVRDGAATALPDDGWALPVWRTGDGRLLVLTGSSAEGANHQAARGLPLPGVLAPGTAFQTAGVRWSPMPHAYTRAGINRMALDGTSHAACAAGDAACLQDQDRWSGGQVGGGYSFGGFTVDVGASWLDHAGSRQNLPMVLPEPGGNLGGVLGMPGQWVDSLGGVNASGSLRLGDDARVDLGASVGRLRMLPGNESGLDAIDQRALSFGMGAGPVSGTIVGRVMQPIGAGSGLPGLTQRWSAVDLGITVRFPWEGELSVGAQNLWSSGHASLPATPAEPAQSRVPYIQYHQEL